MSTNDDADPVLNQTHLFLQADAVIKGLLDTVDSQQRELQKLSATVNQLTRIVQRELGLMHDQPACSEKERGNNLSITERVALLEERTVIPGVSGMTIGEGVAANRRTLAQAFQLISEKVHADEMSSLSEHVELRIVDEVKKVRNHMVDKTETSSISDAVAALTKRMGILSADMQNKVDNSTFKSITSDATALRGHAKFVTRMEHNIQRLSEASEQQGAVLSEQEALVSAMTSHVESLHTDVGNKAESESLSSLEIEVNRVKAEIKTAACKSENDMADMDKNIMATLNEVELIKRDANASALDIRRRLDGTYERREIEQLLGKCVLKSKFNAVLKELRSEVGAKCWDQDARNLARSLSELTSDHANTKRMATLAAQFVDWYGKRGDTFENNVRTS